MLSCLGLRLAHVSTNQWTEVCYSQLPPMFHFFLNGLPFQLNYLDILPKNRLLLAVFVHSTIPLQTTVSVEAKNYV